MPYKLGMRAGKWCVLVKKGGRWKVKARHPSKRMAMKHLAALKINVKEG